MKYDENGVLLSLDSPFCIVFNPESGEILSVRNDDNLEDNMIAIDEELARHLTSGNSFVSHYVAVVEENGKQIRKVLRKETPLVKTHAVVFDVIPESTGLENVQVVCNKAERKWDISIRDLAEFLEIEKHMVLFVVKNLSLDMLVRPIAVSIESFNNGMYSVPFETLSECDNVAVISKFVKGSRGFKVYE